MGKGRLTYLHMVSGLTCPLLICVHVLPVATAIVTPVLRAVAAPPCQRTSGVMGGRGGAAAWLARFTTGEGKGRGHAGPRQTARKHDGQGHVED
jgi:hypothetical protein